MTVQPSTTDLLRKGIALTVPIVLLVSMYLVFQLLTRRFGYPLGYLLSFIIYWIFWCLLVPVALLGGVKAVLDLFTPFPAFQSLSWKTHLALWWPLLFPLFFVFIPRVMKAGTAILAVSLVLGILIGVTEEILWRGVYMRLFPGSVWLNLAYPALMFAFWHLAPQSVVANRMPGGAVSFVVYALLLGASYAFSVYQTESIAWCTIAHILHDTLGLGGFAYAALLAKPG